MRDSTIDCIVVGYHELPLRLEVADAEHMREQSAHLLSLLTNTLESDGERLTYLGLLNRVVSRVTGHNPNLHVSAMPNLGVTYLRNFLHDAGLEVDAINFFDFERDRLENLLSGNRVTSVAITTTFYTSDAPICNLVNFIRERSPGTRIIVGGPHILNMCSYYGKDILEYSLQLMGADFYVFDSQGEVSLSRLVRALKDGHSDLTHIPNLLIREDRMVRTDRVPENNDLEKHRVQWDRLPNSLVTQSMMTRTARSCAFKCSFCTYPVLAGKLSLMGVDAVEQELRQLQDLGVRNVSFIDDTFNVPPERFKSLCRMMIKNDFSFNWFSYLRCGNIDSEGLDLLAQSGCAGVFLGIESGDDLVLQNMNKKADAEKYKNGIIGLRERNVPSYASIIVGFPGESRDSVQRTMDLLNEAQPAFFHPELYCHYQFAPVAARAADFELKGAGYSWSHKTMDWRQAQECLVEMITSVGESSTYLPTYSFDFWALPYLRGQGLSLDFIDSFLRVCNRIMLNGVVGGDPDRSAGEQELSRLVAESWPGKRSVSGLATSLT